MSPHDNRPDGVKPNSSKRPNPATPRPNYVRRRLLAGTAGLIVLAALLFGGVKLVGALFGGNSDDAVNADSDRGNGKANQKPAAPGNSGPAKNDSGDAATTKPGAEGPTETTVEIPAPPLTPDRAQGEKGSSGVTGLSRVQTLGDTSMSPKSIVASDKGVVFAQNMMYRHSISVFNADGALVRTIPDAVELSKYGIDGHPGISKGAPVEMAFSPDGSTAWVSNYSMYGAGFGPEGDDSCSPGDGTDDSYVYRIDVKTDEIRNVIKVGAVPKYVAVTPDGSKVLVTNWCTWDLSVIDTTTNTESQRVKLDGQYPRGIVVSDDSRTAYVALMGSDRMVTVDLQSFAVAPFASPGDSPRHVVMAPDSSNLYVTNNRDGNVVRIDRSTGNITGTVATGTQPRSMAVSADGEALYVVNYQSSTMTKVRTSDMAVMQTVKTDAHPIGITYEPTKKRVWVACYGGTVIVFDDSRLLTD